jgi:prepilin-type N-terminal cleavage/methylation domain-containing protein
MSIRSRLADREDGFTIIELMAALSVLAIGFMSLAGALGIGFKQIALGRQRQTATEIGNARIEHLRNVPYTSVAMSSAPIHSEDVDDPDRFVSNDGSQFDYSGGDTFEDLVVDETSGQVLHIEDPVTVGATIMTVYQYVTWSDQANNVKRLTVVVVYRPTVIEGAAKLVRISTLFTPGTVTVTGTSAGATQGTSTPTPSATPTATPTGGCSTDTSAPSGTFWILSGTGSQTGYTASTTVSLSMSFTDSCTPITVEFSNDGTNYSSAVTYDSLNPTVSWTLTSGNGTRNVWAKVSDGAGNTATLGPSSIVLDTTAPSVPGTLSRTVSCASSDRTVHLTWGSSTDTNLAGYRAYRSINSAAWTAIGTSSSSTFNDTHKKSLDSVRYYVVGYDRAGNESNATNTIALSKNKCS